MKHEVRSFLGEGAATVTDWDGVQDAEDVLEGDLLEYRDGNAEPGCACSVEIVAIDEDGDEVVVDSAEGEV